MNILFLHPNMPGQYRNLARMFGEEGGHRIFFITKHKTAEMPGVERITYRTPRDASPHSHRYLISTERAILQGQEVWRVAKKLKTERGFVPDIVVAHPGWGDAMFIKDLFPKTRVLGYFEFYYRARGADVNFDPADKITADDYARVRIKNLTNLLSLEMVDWGITPTVWQWSLNPTEFRDKISVLHDGVNVDFCRPDPNAVFTLPDNTKSFRPGDEVVTYIARNFEPYRGFPTFMHAAEILLKERKNLHIIAVGADEVSYGKPAPKGTTYRKMLTKEVKLPADRMHFIGTVPYDQLIRLFQVSAAHLYLTYPFVLSWSVLEAMAAGVALVASATKPMMEIVDDGRNGLLTDFFSPQDVAKKVITLLDSKDGNAAMRKAAREDMVKRFALNTVMPMHMQLVRDVAGGALPPPITAQIKKFSPIEPYQKAMWDGH